MKKIYLILLFTGIGFRCFAQHEPADFFKGLFNCIKNADSVGFANSFLSGGQFGLLAQAQLKIKIINQDSLDNAAGDDTAAPRVAGRRTAAGATRESASPIR